MARVLITGSSDGLGLMAAEVLAHEGHAVTLHARNAQRAGDARRALPAAEQVVVGDLASIEEARQVAEQANALGRYDTVIHNAGVGYREPRRVETVDGLSQVFAVNVLAPYLLTALINRPSRLVYLSSGMHKGGNPDLDDLQWARRSWNGAQAYADSKLFDAVLAFAVARRWAGVLSNALEPGWVPTKMGGPGAPDDLSLAAVTQV
ncbi:MAG: SDR family NAD(P)-dependent oxidoreductase, partial [Acidimicrobiales bacterium]